MHVVAQPFRSAQSIFSQNPDDFRIRDIVAALHDVFIEQIDGILDPFLFLQPVARSGHFRTGDQRVAADHRHFFQHENARAVFLRGDRRRHAGSAGA